ncbi:MAG: LLM class F420-dependent oxidoreductase [Gammaproteobacteria bacterium]|jgi:probable F420-dependent oxidoreductase
MNAMRYGFSVVVRGDAATVDTFDAIAAHAEALNIDCLWVSDHLIFPAMRVSRYPGSADGQMPAAWKSTYYQPFSVLNYLAARTARVRLGTSVLILPMRNAIEVAAQVAELDQLSRGRMNFGVGVGWYQEEFEALGYRFADRGARTDDALTVIKTLWSQATTSVHGPHYEFEEAALGPKPRQQPHPPIYIGGNTPAAMRRVAAHGDVWHPFKLSPADVADGARVLAHALELAERESTNFPIAPKIPLTFQNEPATGAQAVTQGRPRDIVDGLRAYRDAGAGEFCFDIVDETLPCALDTMSRFAEEVRPQLED